MKKKKKVDKIDTTFKSDVHLLLRDEVVDFQVERLE